MTTWQILGVDLMQSAVTAWCPPVLRKPGVRSSE